LRLVLGFVVFLNLCILGGIVLAVQAILLIYTHFSVVCPSVCLSVCHTRAPCLNQLTDLDAI